MKHRFAFGKTSSWRFATGGVAMVALLFAIWSSISVHAAPGSNAVDELFENASDGSPAIEMIRAAQQSIDLEIYTMKDTNVIAELATAMQRGVKLRVVQTPNPVGDPCSIFKPNDSTTSTDCQTLRSFADYVRKYGGQYKAFSYDLCGSKGRSCFQHGKMLVVDGTTAMVSTGNLDPSSLCDVALKPAHCNRDFTMATTDQSVVKALETIFSKDLIGSQYDLLTVLQSSPRLTASPLSMKPIVDFINSAKKTIQIENQYLNDPTMNQALIDASKRGVKVFVMVASVVSFGRLNATDDQLKIQRWTNNFTAFDRAGIKSRIFDDHMKVNGQSGYLHAKAILVDGRHAWIGSVNGSTKSLTENREFGMFSDEATVVQHLGQVLYADFADRNSETWQQSLTCDKDACSSQGSGGEDEGTDEETAQAFTPYVF